MKIKMITSTFAILLIALISLTVFKLVGYDEVETDELYDVDYLGSNLEFCSFTRSEPESSLEIQIKVINYNDAELLVKERNQGKGNQTSVDRYVISMNGLESVKTFLRDYDLANWAKYPPKENFKPDVEFSLKFKLGGKIYQADNYREVPEEFQKVFKEYEELLLSLIPE